jgi:hypothetical protein
MDVWFYSQIGTAAERPTRRAEAEKEFYTRTPPERLRRAFCLLTRTYHGRPVTGNLGTGSDL